MLVALLTYWRTRWDACIWTVVGLSIYWLSCWKAKEMFSLEYVKYKSHPTKRLYCKPSSRKVPYSLLSLSLESIGVLAGLDSRNLSSCKISKAYFHWLKKMPWCALATSKPRKNFNVPKSLIFELEMQIRFNSSDFI